MNQDDSMVTHTQRNTLEILKTKATIQYRVHHGKKLKKKKNDFIKLNKKKK